MGKKILIIEDEKSILQGLMDNLKEEGFEVIGEGLGKKGLKTALREDLDLVLLDLMLPDMNGLDICAEIKKKKIFLPIIILTAKSKECDKIVGLELGADDYIAKPFSINEVLARIQAMLRRCAIHKKAKKEKIKKYKIGEIKVDFIRLEAVRGKKSIRLSKREYDVLEYLIKRKGETVTRNDILDVLWGYDSFPTTRTVDNFIWRLRKKIEKNPSKPRYLESVRTKGYRFVKK